MASTLSERDRALLRDAIARKRLQVDSVCEAVINIRRTDIYRRCKKTAIVNGLCWYHSRKAASE